MDDQEFYERLNRVSSELVWEGSEELLSREDIDQLRTALIDLGLQPTTESDRERLAALRAVSAQLNRLEQLL